MSLPACLPILRGGEIVLRDFAHDDLEMIREAADDRYIPAVTTVPSRYTEIEGLAYIERNRSRVGDGAGYSFAIADATNDRGLGQIGVWIGNAGSGRASIGCWVRPSARGRGVATRALSLISRWALSFPELPRIELCVEPWNTASWTVAERAGFHREGVLRSWQWISGTRRDMYMYSLLVDDL